MLSSNNLSSFSFCGVFVGCSAAKTHNTHTWATHSASQAVQHFLCGLPLFILYIFFSSGTIALNSFSLCTQNGTQTKHHTKKILYTRTSKEKYISQNQHLNKHPSENWTSFVALLGNIEGLKLLEEMDDAHLLLSGFCWVSICCSLSQWPCTLQGELEKAFTGVLLVPLAPSSAVTMEVYITADWNCIFKGRVESLFFMEGLNVLGWHFYFHPMHVFYEISSRGTQQSLWGGPNRSERNRTGLRDLDVQNGKWTGLWIEIIQ